MAPKKTNIKIKRSKINLYNKKKSKTRQAFKIVITVVIICGLGVLGYGLGKPLLKYIRERGENSSQSDSDTSALLSSIMDSINSETSDSGQAGTDSSALTSEPTPEQTAANSIYYLPDNAAASEASLKNALTAAKKSGCSIVAVTLKDTTGHLLYKTSIDKVKNTDAVTGELTAAQIAQTISGEGLTPAARINTLLDPLGSIYVNGHFTFSPDQGGYTWNDERADKGGKAWMSPFKTEAADYIGSIANELSQAGYKHIICVNTRYPAFHNIDITTYLRHLPLTDSSMRVNALWSIVTSAKSSAEKNGAKTWIEISGKNLIAENKDCTDAELVADKEKLKSVNIAVVYDISNTAPAPSNTPGAPNTTDPSGGSMYYQNARSFAAKAKSALGGAEFSVYLPKTLTGTALDDVKRALEEANINVF